MIKISFSEFLLGKRQRLTWVEETSYATGGVMATDGVMVGLEARMEPDFNQNWMEVLSAGTDDRYVQDRVLGPLALPFTLTFVPVEWKFLRHCGYSVTNTAPTPFTHTFTVANAINSFKLEWALQHTTDVVFTLTGCTVLSATINFAKATGEGAEGFISVSLRCVAKAYSIGSSVTTVSAVTREPFQWRHVLATLDNSAVVEVNNGEITIDQGIDVNDSRYCNTTAARALGEPIPKVHRITGRLNVNLKDSTFMDMWHTMAVITNCKLDFIETAATNELKTVLASFRLHNAPFPPTNLEGVDAADLVFSAQSFTSMVAKDTLDDY